MWFRPFCISTYMTFSSAAFTYLQGLFSENRSQTQQKSKLMLYLIVILTEFMELCDSRLSLHLQITSFSKQENEVQGPRNTQPLPWIVRVVLFVGIQRTSFSISTVFMSTYIIIQ